MTQTKVIEEAEGLCPVAKDNDRFQGGCPSRIDRRHLLGALVAGALLPVVGVRAAEAAAPDKPLPLIMLDPGHGGHDPGAIGVTGLFEKHVALRTARDLKEALASTGRYRVMLTRNDDAFIPLEQRRAYAQAHDARMFVSIHADALRDRSVRGASVYTLSLKASDTQSDELARREDSVDPEAAKEYRAYSPEVATILASLARKETRVFSAHLQNDIVAALSHDILMLHNPSRHADFVVLRSSDVPSVLVEMGFMSNEADELLLESDAHRKHVVCALQSGIDACMTTLSVLRPSHAAAAPSRELHLVNGLV